MKKFKFEFTEQEVNLVLAGLGKLPAEASLKLILEVQKLATAQIESTDVEEVELVKE